MHWLSKLHIKCALVVHYWHSLALRAAQERPFTWLPHLQPSDIHHVNPLLPCNQPPRPATAPPHLPQYCCGLAAGGPQVC
jgi:hypothetical protein